MIAQQGGFIYHRPEYDHDGNYWINLPDDSKYKIILGVLIIFSGGIIYPGFSIGIPWLNLDMNPTKEPYDI